VISASEDQTPERGGNDGADGKARKTKNRFPSLSHRALGNRCRDSHIPTAPVTVSLFSKPKRKEPLATDLHLFRSGSFFDEKMLGFGSGSRSATGCPKFGVPSEFHVNGCALGERRFPQPSCASGFAW